MNSRILKYVVDCAMEYAMTLVDPQTLEVQHGYLYVDLSTFEYKLVKMLELQNYNNALVAVI